jgi:Protein of unknown function (DUF4236)/Putative peptidoglycan binding domain
MGWRFRSRVSLGRFARLNFGKSGVSLGLGRRGLNVNIGQKGVRTTVGLPGTGLSYQTFEPWRQRGRVPNNSPPPLASPGQPSRFPRRLTISIVIAIVLVLGGRMVLHSPSPSTSSPIPSVHPEMAASIATTPAPAASMDADGIREIQSLLEEFGHSPGTVDGVNGPLTRKAIQDYLRAKGLAGSPDPSLELLVRLRLDKSHRLLGGAASHK